MTNLLNIIFNEFGIWILDLSLFVFIFHKGIILWPLSTEEYDFFGFWVKVHL